MAPKGQRMIFTKYAVWLGCYLHHVGIQRGNVAFHLDIYILASVWRGWVSKIPSLGSDERNYQDQLLRSSHPVYSESRSLLGRLRNTRLKAMPMLQHCGWGMYLANLMKEMRDLGFLRHVAYPTVLLFCFLKAFIKNHESKIWFWFSPTKRFFAPEV